MKDDKKKEIKKPKVEGFVKTSPGGKFYWECVATDSKGKESRWASGKEFDNEETAKRELELNMKEAQKSL